MQPYYLPYIGYRQLVLSVDVFVAYDKLREKALNRIRIA